MRGSNAPLVGIAILAILCGFSNNAYSITYVTVTPGENLRGIIEGAVNDTVITLTAGTFDLTSLPVNGIHIENKTNVTITG